MSDYIPNTHKIAELQQENEPGFIQSHRPLQPQQEEDHISRRGSFPCPTQIYPVKEISIQKSGFDLATFISDSAVSTQKRILG